MWVEKREIIFADNIYWYTWKWIKINLITVLLCYLSCKNMRWPAFSLQEKGIYIKIYTLGIWKWNKNFSLPGLSGSQPLLPPVSQALSRLSLMSHTSLFGPLLSPRTPKWSFWVDILERAVCWRGPCWAEPTFRALSLVTSCGRCPLVHLLPVTCSDAFFRTEVQGCSQSWSWKRVWYRRLNWCGLYILLC